MSTIVNDDESYIDNVDENSIDIIVDERSDSLKIQEKRIRCRIFEEIKRDDFLTWWITTKWALSHQNQKNKKIKRMYWNNEKKIIIWEHFFEEATFDENTSKIVCKRCYLILNHSFVENDTNIAKSHLSSKQCSETFKISDLFQLTLIKTWKKMSFILLRFLIRLFLNKISEISIKINTIFKCCHTCIIQISWHERLV